MVDQIDHWTARVKATGSLRGKFGNYALQIEAIDLGIPQNSHEASLSICVTDYNDNPPVFTSPPHNTTIRIPEVFLLIKKNYH